MFFFEEFPMKSRISAAPSKSFFVVAAWLCLASCAWAQTNTITVTVQQSRSFPSSVAVDTDILLHYHATATQTAPGSGCTLEWTWTMPTVALSCGKAVLAQNYDLLITSAAAKPASLTVTFTPLTPGTWTLSMGGSVTATSSCGSQNPADATERNPVSLVATNGHITTYKSDTMTETDPVAAKDRNLQGVSLKAGGEDSTESALFIPEPAWVTLVNSYRAGFNATAEQLAARIATKTTEVSNAPVGSERWKRLSLELSRLQGARDQVLHDKRLFDDVVRNPIRLRVPLNQIIQVLRRFESETLEREENRLSNASAQAYLNYSNNDTLANEQAYEHAHARSRRVDVDRSSIRVLLSQLRDLR
jgi:hypothetical protein